MMAGCFSTLGNNPFDVVKTQMQGTQAKQYANTLDCFRKILSNDGVMAFYKGVFARMGRVVPGQVGIKVIDGMCLYTIHVCHVYMNITYVYMYIMCMCLSIMCVSIIHVFKRTSCFVYAKGLFYLHVILIITYLILLLTYTSFIEYRCFMN